MQNKTGGKTKNKAKKRIAISKEDRRFDIFCYSVMALALIIAVYPLYFMAIASISSPEKVMTGKVVFFPAWHRRFPCRLFLSEHLRVCV